MVRGTVFYGVIVEHKTEIETNGEGMNELMTPVCSCGWRGIGYEAHNDWQWKNVQDQINGHLIANHTINMKAGRKGVYE